MQVWDWAAVIGSFLVVGWFAWVMLQGDDERVEEDEARAFFDEHNRWPDEPEPPQPAP